MTGRHCFGVGQIASVGLLVLIASWQVIEPKPLEPEPIDRQSRAQNQRSNKAAAPVDQIAAILSAKPRLTGAQTQKLEAQSSSKFVQTNTQPTLSPETNRKSNKTQPNKRQTGLLLDHSNGSPTGARSRRSEDAWFLDQAPLPLQPYRFVYNVKGNNGLTEQYRQEAGDGKFLTGSYGYVLPDGIYRHVDYVADDRGFRAFIRTSEPGTANENPADVVINSNPVPQQAGPSYTSARSAPNAIGLVSGANVNATSLWNFAGTPQGYASNDASRSRDGGSLDWRPSGSIANTPSRNFNSFGYVQPQSSLPTLPNNFPSNNFSSLQAAQFEPLPPLFESTRASPPAGNNLNVTQLQPTSWASNSWTDRKPSNNDKTGPDPLVNKFAPLSSFDLPRRTSQDSFFGGAALDQSRNRAANIFEPPTREQSQADRQTNTVSRAILNPAPLARFGPNLLRYDQPFVSYPRDDTRRIHYDSSYVFHPDSPFLSLERAKNIAQLERFHTVTQGLSFHPSRPLDSTGLLRSNEVRQSTQPTAPSTGPSSNGRSEQHQELHASRQFVDFTGKLIVAKEHKSGLSTLVGGEGSQTSGQLDANVGSDQLLHPPEPQFQSALSKRVNQGQQRSGDSGVKGQAKGRLMAPYAGHLDQQQEQLVQDEFPGVKGGQLSRQNENQRAQGTLETFGPMPPTPPSPHEDTKGGRSQPNKESERSRFPNKPVTTRDERPADEIELSKGAAKDTSDESKSISSRTVRVPEEYRSRMLIMNDIRSMQNSIGLPQPPRFQRSSLASAEESLFSPTRSDPSDGLVLVRPAQANAPSHLSNRLETIEPKKTQSDEQARRLSSGRLEQSAQIEETPLLVGKETFEALRLSANKAQNLRSDKLSELEKFQQRLRSQQKLLESIKSPVDSPSKQNVPPASRTPNATANSHVKYDEPNDYEPQHSANQAANEATQRPPKSPAAGAPSGNQNQTSGTAGNGSPIEHKLVHVHKLDLNGRGGDGKEAHENEIKSGEGELKKPEPRSPNTINLDFINSVTALAVDHSNPFAISSVNPAIQRSSERLSPHKLSLPVVGNSTSLSASNSFIGSAARLLGFPNSVAPYDHQERRDSDSLLGRALRIDATGSSSLVPNNHRVALSEQSPVASGPAHFLYEAANSPHKSFVPTPVGAQREVRNLDTNRDGFEIRDRSVQMDSHKFFEVVAN